MAHKLGVMKQYKGKQEFLRSFKEEKPMSSLGAKLQKRMLFDDDVSGGDAGVDLSAKLDRLLAELEIPNPWVASCKHGLLNLWGCQGIGTWCLPCTQWVHDDMHETLQSHVSNLEAWLTPEDYYIGALSAWGLRCLQKRSPVSKTGWNKVTCKQKTKEMLAMSLPVLKAHIQDLLETSSDKVDDDENYDNKVDDDDDDDVSLADDSDVVGSHTDGDLCANAGCGLPQNCRIAKTFQFCCRKCKGTNGPHGRLCTMHWAPTPQTPRPRRSHEPTPPVEPPPRHLVPQQDLGHVEHTDRWWYGPKSSSSTSRWMRTTVKKEEEFGND